MAVLRFITRSELGRLYDRQVSDSRLRGCACISFTPTDNFSIWPRALPLSRQLIVPSAARSSPTTTEIRCRRPTGLPSRFIGSMMLKIESIATTPLRGSQLQASD